MDAQERLTVEEALAPTLLGSMHVHRYELVAELCRGLRVADVGCGTGYGSEILARESSYVLGVDVDEQTISAAEEQLGTPGRLEFEVADAHDFLRRRLRDEFDAVVILETLEHLGGLDDALTSLRRQAEDGVKLAVSVPNSRMLDEDNPYHVTDFGFEEAQSAFADFPDTQVVYQFIAEGSLFQVGEIDDGRRELDLRKQGEREYANQFIALVNFGDRELAASSALLRVQTEPLQHRYLIGLERANQALYRVNVRLARGLLGRADSAAASLVARVERLERELAGASRSPEHARELERLDQEITELNRTIAEMQDTRTWRFASRFWSFKRRLRPGG